jgi:hypothetical protein
MADVVQVKAVIPRGLKRRVFSVLALREETFTHWLLEQMEILLMIGERRREKEGHGVYDATIHE